MRMSSEGIISSSLFNVFHTRKFMINTGLVLLQKDSRYCPSFFVICPETTISAAVFAPIGYPHKKPVITAKLPQGDTRNRRERNFPVTDEIREIFPVPTKRELIRRKGNKVGRTI